MPKPVQILPQPPTVAHSLAPILLALLATLLPAVLWPGDVPWVNDEPAEISIAFSANQEHHLAFHALSGNFGVWYGPLPIQLNQLFLLFSHDPRVIVVLRGALLGLTTAASLLWLGRTLRLNLWFVTAI